MQSVNECFDNVKEDYLKFLNKEKIFGKSKAEKITSLKKIYIPISFWIENKYKKKRRNFNFRIFWRTRFSKNNSYRYSKNYFKKIL